MTSPRRHSQHKMDGDHARVIEALNQWKIEIYPEIVRQDADRTRQWWQTSAHLLATFELAHPDPRAAAAALAQFAAEAMLSNAELYPPPDP